MSNGTLEPMAIAEEEEIIGTSLAGPTNYLWLAVQAAGYRALLLVWDNAPWHVSRAVRAWIRAHNRQVKWAGRGVRIVPCYLPIKSPWLNPIEPKWAHGKRRVVEPARLLSADELIDRVCAAFGCELVPHLLIPEKVA